MNIRSVTCFVNAIDSQDQAELIKTAGRLAQETRVALRSAGFPVQTARLATQPLSHLPGEHLGLGSALWAHCADAGFQYLSLGPVLADTQEADLGLIDRIPQLINSTEAIFVSVLVARSGKGINLEAIRRTARVVCEIAHSSPQGFGNLRLAVLANVGPHFPFFPAAYHDGGPPVVALATEAAGLAVDAFSASGSLEEVGARLVSKVEEVARQATRAVEPLARNHGFLFAGIDFSLAPFPDEARSIAAAMERLGVERFGAPGTLFVSSFLTDCLRRAVFVHCGFNGLMLPVLEDSVLADRSRERLFSVNDLLLYSAVCGTGLDTVPLPGDVREEEVAGILLDMAALAVRHDKPLTARLMPIPGAKAGDLTEFDFAYFANGQVLDVKGYGSPGLFERSAWLDTV